MRDGGSRRIARPGRRHRRSPPTLPSTPSPGRSCISGPARLAPRASADARRRHRPERLRRLPRTAAPETTKGATMKLPVSGATRPARARRARDPRAAPARRARWPTVRHLRRQTTSAVWSDENWTLHPPGRRAAFPARSGWRAVCMPTRSAICPSRCSRVRPRRRSRRARDPVARRRRPRAPVPLGRRRGALSRLVHAAAARHGRGAGDDAAALGGRAAERARRRSSRRRRETRRRARCDE